MKLTMQRMIGGWTSCLLSLVVILGLIAAATIAAQESKPVQAVVSDGGVAGEVATAKPDAVADSKMPDISGIWAYETPELPLLIFDAKTKARFKADVATTEKLLMRIRRAADSSADFTFENIELTRLPQDPASQAESAPAPQIERLKWSPKSRKFDVLGADQKTASGITIELLDRDQFRLSRKVDEAERKRLIEEVGIPESAIEKLRNQVWKRVPVEVADAATATNSARNGDAANPKTSTPDANAKLPDPIQSLMPSIVTVTRMAPEEGDAATKPVSHAGVVVDPRGYIVIPLLPSPLKPKLFAIRFSDQEEVVGQLAAVDELLKLGVVKVERPRPVAAVSLAKSREARVDDRVLLVPSPRSKELRGGRVTSTTMVLGAEGSTKLIQSDVMFPVSEYGSLMVSEAGEVIGLLMASRGDPKPTSFALPVKAVLPLVQSAIDKPKDVPVATVPASPPFTGSEQLQIGFLSGVFSVEPQAAPLDMLKPVQIGLQPATPLHKSLAELYRIKVVDYAEGKRLKIEAPPLDLLALGKLLELVAREYEKEAEVFDASQTLKVGLQPPTPLVKSLVELFAKRGAKVLDYEPGKRLQIEAPPKVMEDLGKILEVVGREYQKNEGKTEANAPPTKARDPAAPKVEATTAPTLPVADAKIPEVIGTWSRAEGGTFSKLTIWPVENHESLVFVEGADGNGLMERRQPFFTPINFRGFFTLNLLGDRTAEIGLQEGSKEAMQLFLWPAEDQRKQLLRSGFAKTEQELDQKLSAVWNRADPPGPSKSKLTASVFKTDVEPKRVRDALRAKYPEPDYRFFSNETKHSVIVLAPAEAQDEIEVALHKLDVKEDSSEEGVSTKGSVGVPAGMPDISGKWAYDPPALSPDDLNGALVAPPQMFVVNRSKQDGIDFEFLGTREPTAAPTRLKWEPGTRRFQVVPFDDSAKQKRTFDLSADGNQLTVRSLMAADETKRLAAKGGLTEKEFTDRYLTQEWRRVGSGKAAAPTPLKEPAKAPTSNVQMPDITGTWAPYARNEVIIRRVKIDGVDFEMTTRLLPQFKKSDSYAEDTPPRRIKWFPKAQHFQTLDPRNRGIATLTMKPNADGKSMHVTVTINGKPVDEKQFGNGSGEMEWQRTESDDSQSANTSAEPEFGQRPRTNAPNIGGRWREADKETDHFVIRPRQTGTGFEIASLDDDQPFEGIVEWSREKGRFEGTATIPRNFKGPIPLVLDPEDGGKKMRVRLSLSDEQRKSMLKHWQEAAEKHRVQEIDSPKEQEEALIASCHQVWVRGADGFPPVSSLPTEPAAAAPRLTASALPDTPAAKRLVEQLSAQESAAAAEAGTLRQLQANGQTEENEQAIADHQRKLKNLLSTAFDLKLQLEELQVQELQSRLSRLERQIGQRKELRERIINRRAGELIEGDALKWDSTGDNARPQVVTDTKSKAAAQGAQGIEQFVETTQIRFTGPIGMKVFIAGGPSELIAPGRHNFVRHASETRRYDLGFVKIPSAPDSQFTALLDIFPSTPDSKEFLDHNAVPINLTDEDTRVASTDLLIKVIYLHKPLGVLAAIPEIKTLLSTDFNAKGDAIAAASGYGTILAVLRLAENADQLGTLEPKSSNTSVMRPPPATPNTVEILRERFGLLWDDLLSGKAKPAVVLRALNELAQAEPPEAHTQHVERLQALLELVRQLQSADSVSKAEVLEMEAAYEKARSLPATFHQRN